MHRYASWRSRAFLATWVVCTSGLLVACGNGISPHSGGGPLAEGPLFEVMGEPSPSEGNPDAEIQEPLDELDGTASTEPETSSNDGASADQDDGSEPAAEPAQDPMQTQQPRTYCDAMEKVFHQSCGNGSCHTNAGANIGDFAIDLEHARRYVDRASVRDPACGLVIDSEDPLNSLMFSKVTGSYPRGCGGIMPVGSFDFTYQQIDCLADWLLQFKR